MAPVMTLERFNALPAAEAAAAIRECCGCARFAARVAAAARPAASVRALQATARRAWFADATAAEWLEALASHPRIGGDLAALRARFGGGSAHAQWAQGEQSAAMATAGEEVLAELSEWNTLYEERFGHVFVICATGVPADRVLSELRRRYAAAPHAELAVAAEEQAKITALRIDKLFGAGAAAAGAAVSETAARRVETVAKQVAPAPSRSPITTHVLDQARGCPARGVAISLALRGADGAYALLGEGVTNDDGRLPTLLPPGHALAAGVYKISFECGEYEMRASGGQGAGFYPEASIVFEVRPDQTGQHFHVPLLLSPYGYATYRGS